MAASLWIFDTETDNSTVTEEMLWGELVTIGWDETEVHNFIEEEEIEIVPHMYIIDDELDIILCDVFQYTSNY